MAYQHIFPELQVEIDSNTLDILFNCKRQLTCIEGRNAGNNREYQEQVYIKKTKWRKNRISAIKSIFLVIYMKEESMKNEISNKSEYHIAPLLSSVKVQG